MFTKRQGTRTIGPNEQQPLPRHEIHQPSKRQAHRVDIGVDVRVVEFDIVDNRDIWQVLEKLGGLVEECTVVLVALDDEVSPLTESITRAVVAEVADDAAD